MPSAINRVCNVDTVDSETTRFEWVVGSLSKFQLGDKVSALLALDHLRLISYTVCGLSNALTSVEDRCRAPR